MSLFLRLNPSDNVATALEDTPENEMVVLDGKQIGVKTTEPIPFEHKVALCEIPKGSRVIKYGVPIGIAYKAIAAGDHVHLHNLKSLMIEPENGTKELDESAWSNRI